MYIYIYLYVTYVFFSILAMVVLLKISQTWRHLAWNAALWWASQYTDLRWIKTGVTMDGWPDAHQIGIYKLYTYVICL